MHGHYNELYGTKNILPSAIRRTIFPNDLLGAYATIESNLGVDQRIAALEY